MAIPTLTPNSPVAGSIAWSAFNIRYGGVTYSVGASSTALRYTWWVYNNGSPILAAGAMVPELGPDDLLLFLNKDGLPINLQASTVVDGSLIVDGTVVAPALAVGIIDSTHIVTDGLDAGVIKFGTMSGDRLESTAIDGMTITGALFRTAADGARVQIDGAGLLQYSATNTLLTRIGGDSNYFSGIVDASQIIVRGGLELYGQDNIFAPNSKVTLRTGAGGSATPPTLNITYEAQSIGSSHLIGFRPLVGYHRSGSEEISVSEFFGEGRMTNGNNYYDLEKFTVPTTDGGTVTKYAPGGLVRIQTSAGPRTVILTQFADNPFPAGTYRTIHTRVFDDSPMNTSGTGVPLDKAGSSRYWHPFSFFRSSVIGRRFGSDAAYASKCYCYATLLDDVLDMYTVEVNGDASSAIAHNKTGFNFATHRVHPDERLTGISFGPASKMKLYTIDGANPDAEFWVVNTTHQNIVLDLAGNTRVPELEWPVLPGTTHRVHAHGQTSTNEFLYFAHLTPSNNYNQPASALTKYSNWSWKGVAIRRWYQFAWRGHSSKAPAWYTTPSPMSSIIPVKRARVSMNVPVLPPPEAGVGTTRDQAKDIFGWVYYAGTGASAPSNSFMFMQSSPSGDPTTVTALDLSDFPTTSGVIPVTATTGFPSLSPSKIVSSAAFGGVPLLEIDGDGNIKAKTLTVSGVTTLTTLDATTYKRLGVEQGVWTTYTPTLAAESGSFTSATAQGRYARNGKVINFYVMVTITNAGTAGGGIRVGLPVTAYHPFPAVIPGRENQSTGTMLQGIMANDHVNVFTYTNGSIIGSNRTVILGGSYEAA